MTDQQDDTNLTWRRYQDGDSAPVPLEEKIFNAGHTHQCPTYVHRTPPCQGSCPSGHDFRGWLAIARGMDKPPVEGMPWQEYAFERMIAANPFPSIMGRVCPAPCEDGCNRNEVEDFVGINADGHYVGDWAIENGRTVEGPKVETDKRIAVVGGGFPETQAPALAANRSLRGQIRAALEGGMPAYGECGGLIYWSRGVEWRGQRHEMVGFVPGDVVMGERPVGRGYVRLRATGQSPWSDGPEELAAHEFHYAALENLPEIGRAHV